MLRAALADPANFGPVGIIPRTVEICPGTPALTAAYLADKDIFFTSVFDGDLTTTEAAAIGDFVAAGKLLIVEANSLPIEQTAANSMLSGIGATARLGPALICTGDANGGTFGAPNGVTNGPFGDISGGTYGTSGHAVASLDGREDAIADCSGTPVRGFFRRGALGNGSGPVLYGGDPSGLDLFTSVGSSLFNRNNLTLYLNTIALASAECFLVLGSGPGHASYATAGHRWETQLAGIQASYAVTLDDLPLFPLSAIDGMRSLARPTKIAELSAQVVMWNPGVFPANPEQSTGGLTVTLWSSGRITSRRFGSADGMQLDVDVVTGVDGARSVRLPFTIQGL